jgi:hypothetical protein
VLGLYTLSRVSKKSVVRDSMTMARVTQVNTIQYGCFETVKLPSML